MKLEAHFDGRVNPRGVISYGFVLLENSRIKHYDFGIYEGDIRPPVSSVFSEAIAFCKLMDKVEVLYGVDAAITVYGDCDQVIRLASGKTQDVKPDRNIMGAVKTMSGKFNNATFLHFSRKNNTFSDRLCRIATLQGLEQTKALNQLVVDFGA